MRTAFGIGLDVLDTLTSGSFGSSGVRNYTVGQASTDDPSVSLSNPTLITTNQNNAWDGSTIKLSQGGKAVIGVTATFLAAGQYDVTVVNQNATGWDAPTLVVPQNGSLTFSSVPSPQSVQFLVSAVNANPQSGGQVVLKIGTHGGSLGTTLSLPLVAATA